MQKLKCLLFLPVISIMLSSCSLKDLKTFVKDNIYNPILNFISPEKEQQSEQEENKTNTPEEYINPTPTPIDPENNTNPEEPETPEQPEEPDDPVIPEPVYDETADSVEGVDVLDLSDLYNTIDLVKENYTALIKGYFNEVTSYDYYRCYQKNYVCDKTVFYTEDLKYTLPELDVYLPVCNTGYLNKDNNYYSFALKGETKEERLNYNLTNEDLVDEVEGKRYQDDLFTVSDLSETYFTEKGFTRISSNKYECKDRFVCEEFIPICAPDLINEGYFLTFSRITIETNPDNENTLRIRLYVSPTQKGKLIETHKDQENKPNWYLLFSEAYISNVGTTTFPPASSLLSE